MTATVPDVARVLLDTIQPPPCEVLDDNGHHYQRCTDPAAWIVTFTHRLVPMREAVLHCVHHKAFLDEHRTQCQRCTAFWNVTAVEL